MSCLLELNELTMFIAYICYILNNENMKKSACIISLLQELNQYFSIKRSGILNRIEVFEKKKSRIEHCLFHSEFPWAAILIIK